MGQKMSANANFPEGAIETYVRAEFKAMDTDNDGVLSRQQLIDLLVELGYAAAERKARALHVKSEDSIKLEDYVKAVLKDKPLLQETSRMRILFNYFDQNNDGSATQAEMVKGLRDMNMKDDKDWAKTVSDMDANHDGKISYEEFLRVQLAISMKPK